MIDINIANFITIGLISVVSYAALQALLSFLGGMGITIPFLSPPVAA